MSEDGSQGARGERFKLPWGSIVLVIGAAMLGAFAYRDYLSGKALGQRQEVLRLLAACEAEQTTLKQAPQAPRFTVGFASLQNSDALPPLTGGNRGQIEAYLQRGAPKPDVACSDWALYLKTLE